VIIFFVGRLVQIVEPLESRRQCVPTHFKFISNLKSCKLSGLKFYLSQERTFNSLVLTGLLGTEKDCWTFLCTYGITNHIWNSPTHITTHCAANEISFEHC
jgi:hypothetical protein